MRASWADSPEARAQALDRVFPESLLWKARKARPIRRKLIRVISARDMNRNETETHERYEEETS
jgi:uncharacterized DUF497 family protein